MLLTTNILKVASPKTAQIILDNFVSIFNEFAPRYGITTPERISAFVGNTIVESGLKPIKEGGNNEYFIKNYWLKKSKALELGYTKPQDAIDYAGKGYIQVTGKKNYAKISQRLFNDDRLVKNPSLLLEPKMAMLTSLEWWKMNDMNAVSDQYGIKGVASKINTGSVKNNPKHLPERLKAYDTIIEQLKKKVNNKSIFGFKTGNIFGNFMDALAQ